MRSRPTPPRTDPADYPLIRAECDVQGLWPAWLDAQLARARADGAPADAIAYSPTTGRFLTPADYPPGYGDRLRRHALGRGWLGVRRA